MDDKAKKFFQNQQMVKYRKIWYLMDHISKTTKKPDLKYLASFEEKYNINLWSIIYSDREFYHYNPFHKFKEDEILSMVEQECRFFEGVLDEVKPKFLSIFMTVAHYQELIYRICKARGIKILMLGSARFGNRMMISEEAGILDHTGKQTRNKSSKTIEELQSYLRSFDSSKEGSEYRRISFEAHVWDRYKSLLNFFFSIRNKNYKNRYTNYGKTRFNVLRIKILNLLEKKYRSFFIDRNLKTTLDENTPFIYFPLQMEPERVLLIGAQFYTNQLAVITNIAKSLPVGYKLYVKEHPIMKILGWREVSYYKQIMDLPNVVLVHPSISSEELIKKCSLVITIAGTAGQEAAFHNKPVISFTNQLYSHLSSVKNLKIIEELPTLIRESLKKKVNITSLNEYVEMINESTFELNLIDTSADFAYRFGFKGLIMDADMPIQKVESFLKDYESIFEQLTIEHMKKIKQYEENESRN